MPKALLFWAVLGLPPNSRAGDFIAPVPAAAVVDVVAVETKVANAVCLEQTNVFLNQGVSVRLGAGSQIMVYQAPNGTLCLCLSRLQDMAIARDLLFMLRPAADAFAVYNGSLAGPDTVEMLPNGDFLVTTSPAIYSAFFYDAATDVFVALDQYSLGILTVPFAGPWFPIQPTVAFLQPAAVPKARDIKWKIKDLDPTKSPAKALQYALYAWRVQQMIDKNIKAGKCGLKTGDPGSLTDAQKKCRTDYTDKIRTEICWQEFYEPDAKDKTKPDQTKPKLCPDDKDPKNPIIVGHVPDVSAGGPVVQQGCYLPICKCVNSALSGFITGSRNGGEFCYKTFKLCDKDGNELKPNAAQQMAEDANKKARQAKWDAWVLKYPKAFPKECLDFPFPIPDLPTKK